MLLLKAILIRRFDGHTKPICNTIVLRDFLCGTTYVLCARFVAQSIAQSAHLDGTTDLEINCRGLSKVYIVTFLFYLV